MSVFNQIKKVLFEIFVVLWIINQCYRISPRSTLGELRIGLTNIMKRRAHK